MAHARLIAEPVQNTSTFSYIDSKNKVISVTIHLEEIEAEFERLCAEIKANRDVCDNELRKRALERTILLEYLHGYDLELISSLPDDNKNNADDGKIYLSEDGKYIVRDQHGNVHEGNFETTLLDGKSLTDTLDDSTFRSQILQLASEAGYIHLHSPPPTTNYPQPPSPKRSDTHTAPESKLKKAWKYLRYIIYPIMVLGGGGYNIFSSYVSVHHLLITFAIASLPATIISAICSMIFLCLFKDWEIPVLKRNMGLSQKEINSTLSAHRAQIKITKTINSYLEKAGSKMRSAGELKTITRLANIFSKDINEKKIIFEESAAKKWFNRSVTAFCTIIQGALVFYSGTIMVAGATTAAALAAVTPAGWALIIFNVAVALGFYISKRLSSPNKQAEESRKLNGKLDTFTKEYQLTKACMGAQDKNVELTAQTYKLYFQKLKESEEKELVNIQLKALQNNTFSSTQAFLEKNLTFRFKQQEKPEQPHQIHATLFTNEQKSEISHSSSSFDEKALNFNDDSSEPSSSRDSSPSRSFSVNTAPQSIPLFYKNKNDLSRTTSHSDLRNGAGSPDEYLTRCQTPPNDRRPLIVTKDVTVPNSRQSTALST